MKNVGQGCEIVTLQTSCHILALKKIYQWTQNQKKHLGAGSISLYWDFCGHTSSINDDTRSSIQFKA